MSHIDVYRRQVMIQRMHSLGCSQSETFVKYLSLQSDVDLLWTACLNTKSMNISIIFVYLTHLFFFFASSWFFIHFTNCQNEYNISIEPLDSVEFVFYCTSSLMPNMWHEAWCRFCTSVTENINSFEQMPSQCSCSYKLRFEDIGRQLRCECIMSDVFGRSSEPAYVNTATILPGLSAISLNFTFPRALLCYQWMKSPRTIKHLSFFSFEGVGLLPSCIKT